MPPGASKLLMGAAGVALIGLLLWLFGFAQYHRGELAERLVWVQKTNAAVLADTKRKAAVETKQAVVTQEASDDLKTKLADALASAANRPARVCPSASSHSDMPVTSPTASRVNDADQAAELAIERADDVACAENTVKAGGWLNWWKGIENAQEGK